MGGQAEPRPLPCAHGQHCLDCEKGVHLVCMGLFAPHAEGAIHRFFEIQGRPQGAQPSFMEGEQQALAPL